jgi:16S rRNA (guanine527-N7)-methyltransferase
VGSGGGLPGVPLALACPNLSVTLLDAVQKKCAFLTQVKIELRQSNLQVVHARVERWRAPPFAVIVARAFASLRDFVTVSRHLLAQGGVWLAMKGPGLEPELADLPDGIVVDEVIPLTVPGLAETRRLVVLRQRPGGEP